MCRLLLSLWAWSAEWSTRMTSCLQCQPLQVSVKDQQAHAKAKHDVVIVNHA